MRMIYLGGWELGGALGGWAGGGGALFFRPEDGATPPAVMLKIKYLVINNFIVIAGFDRVSKTMLALKNILC